MNEEEETVKDREKLAYPAAGHGDGGECGHDGHGCPGHGCRLRASGTTTTAQNEGGGSPRSKGSGGRDGDAGTVQCGDGAWG